MAMRIKIFSTNFSPERQVFMAKMTIYVDGAGGAPEAIPDFTEIDYALSGPMTQANIYEQCMTFAAKAVASRDSALTSTFGILYP